MYETLADYKADVLRLRRARLLHKRAEEAFTRVVRQVDRAAIAMPESATLSRGHRVDLRFQLADGRAVHAEVFASRATVSRDVNALANSPAEVRMAILLDDDVDKTLADAYFHELASRNLPSDFFPVIKLGRLLAKSESRGLKRELGTVLGIGGHETSITVPLEALRAPATDWYVDKVEERAAINEFMQAFRSSGPLNLFVTGPRGIGKSSFLNALERALHASRIPVVKRTVDTEAWQELMTELADDTRVLVDRSGLRPADPVPGGSAADRFSHGASDAARRLEPGIVFVIDQFERLFERGVQEITELEVERVWRSFTDLAGALRSVCRLAWVVAAREQYYFMAFPRMGHLSDFHFSYVAVRPLGPGESRRLIRRVSSLTGWRLTEDAATLLAERCYHHAQNILLSYVHFFSRRTYAKPADRREMDMAQPWADVFEADLRRLATRTERLVLYAMAESLHEITPFDSIRARVSTQVEISEAELRSVLRRLQDTLWLIKQSRGDVFEFFHAKLADHIRDRHGHEFPVEWSHQRLVETALTLVAEGDTFTAMELMEKAVRANVENHAAYFKAAAWLENEGKLEAATRVLHGLRVLVAELLDRQGYDSDEVFDDPLVYPPNATAAVLGADLRKGLEEAYERATEEIPRLAEQAVSAAEWTWHKVLVLCDAARRVRATRPRVAAAFADRAMNLIEGWCGSQAEELPDGWDLSRAGDTLLALGREQGALVAFRLALKSRGFVRWHRGDLTRAVAILLKRGDYEDALRLRIDSVHGARGPATQAENLADAARLASEIGGRERAKELYRELATRARDLERTSRSEGARRKWARMGDLAESECQ